MPRSLLLSSLLFLVSLALAMSSLLAVLSHSLLWILQLPLAFIYSKNLNLNHGGVCAQLEYKRYKIREAMESCSIITESSCGQETCSRVQVPASQL